MIYRDFLLVLEEPIRYIVLAQPVEAGSSMYPF